MTTRQYQKKRVGRKSRRIGRKSRRIRKMYKGGGDYIIKKEKDNGKFEEISEQITFENLNNTVVFNNEDPVYKITTILSENKKQLGQDTPTQNMSIILDFQENQNTYKLEKKNVFAFGFDATPTPNLQLLIDTIKFIYKSSSDSWIKELTKQISSGSIVGKIKLEHEFITRLDKVKGFIQKAILITDKADYMKDPGEFKTNVTAFYNSLQTYKNPNVK